MNCELVRRSPFLVHRSQSPPFGALLDPNYEFKFRPLQAPLQPQILILRTSGSELKGSPPSTPSNLHRSQTVGRSPRLFAFILNPIFS